MLLYDYFSVPPNTLEGMDQDTRSFRNFPWRVNGKIAGMQGPDNLEKSRRYPVV
jgi:hypothetical protein